MPWTASQTKSIISGLMCNIHFNILILLADADIDGVNY